MIGKLRIAYGARALWRRSPHSSPSPGKPDTWRRGTGGPDDSMWRYATCETLKQRCSSLKIVARKICPWRIIMERPADQDRTPPPRAELITRLMADTCELCGSREEIQIHHVRKFANLNVKGRRERPS